MRAVCNAGRPDLAKRLTHCIKLAAFVVAAGGVAMPKKIDAQLSATLDDIDDEYFEMAERSRTLDRALAARRAPA